ncbi:MAG: hypothetical protein GY820_39005 [Gammaproteobacteria bacterium]|nr:hypothetical protein [Gammaproteobacteria bacterium]
MRLHDKTGEARSVSDFIRKNVDGRLDGYDDPYTRPKKKKRATCDCGATMPRYGVCRGCGTEMIK